MTRNARTRATTAAAAANGRVLEAQSAELRVKVKLVNETLAPILYIKSDTLSANYVCHTTGERRFIPSSIPSAMIRNALALIHPIV